MGTSLLEVLTIVLEQWGTTVGRIALREQE